MTSDESALRDKLRKIEALFAGAATAGEKAAAGAAADRIKARLRTVEKSERAEELKVSISDPWSRRLFVALCRRYGLKPYRYPRMHRQSVLVRMPRSFFDEVLWPEFQHINTALTDHIASITNRIIKDSVFSDVTEAEETAEPLALSAAS